MRKFFKEFKAFIARGNVLNLAVGIIIGGAFNAIITSLVNHVIMPPISLLLGNEVSLLKWVIRPEVRDAADNVVTAEIAISWGLFVQAIINFLLIALVLFVIVRVVTRLNEKAEALRAKLLHKEAAAAPEPEPEPEPSEEVLLLREIRDSLVAKKQEAKATKKKEPKK
ncbi:MAG: large conductance mechanosensitive channel protein MscL [Bacilli bacterium]|jgi:large conductance mechanosensitive channel|nr:large conductance mechanosensitive channel protein MscL [Bacillota bacterium]HOH94601.1 large conductance mechanosensitive channel protein MscL [Bacilli bacterium]